MNPYYLGYTLLVDIEKRWDAMHAAGDTLLSGREKLFDVRRTEDDISFLRNYLTPELMGKLALFAYGRPCTHPPGQRCTQCQEVVITDRTRDEVVEALLTPRYNYGVPRIAIQDVANSMLHLEHLDRTTTYLDRQYANHTLAYVAEPGSTRASADERRTRSRYHVDSTAELSIAFWHGICPSPSLY